MPLLPLKTSCKKRNIDGFGVSKLVCVRNGVLNHLMLFIWVMLFRKLDGRRYQVNILCCNMLLFSFVSLFIFFDIHIPNWNSQLFFFNTQYLDEFVGCLFFVICSLFIVCLNHLKHVQITEKLLQLVQRIFQHIKMRRFTGYECYMLLWRLGWELKM